MNTSPAPELHAYREGANALLGLIRGEHRDSSSPAERRRRAEARMARTRTLLAQLGNPHQRYPIVHVTGTSGKGSTAAAIAAILTAAGHRVGLRTSPYLQVPTEKLQIGSSLIDAEIFGALANRVVDLGRYLESNSWSGSRFGYAEAWSALSFLWFAERHVDIAVVEVGAGGRFDATNVVTPAVSVITSVGLDHLVSLGPTLADIAWHKAGIIKRGSTAVVGALPAEAARVVEAEAARVGAKIVSAANISLAPEWAPGMAGQFQRTNAQLAIASVRALADTSFPVPDSAIQAGLAAARLPGRLERMPGVGGPVVWIDGAHNEDKVAALAVEAARLTPDRRLPVVVLGLLGSKDLEAMAQRLAPFADAIVATRPTVLGKRTREPDQVADALAEAGYTGPVYVDPDPASALLRAERLAAERGTCVLVTGSMYLAGQARSRWYPDDAVVLARTPWPAAAGSAVDLSSVAGPLRRLERHEANGQSHEASDQQVLAGVDEEAIGLER